MTEKKILQPKETRNYFLDLTKWICAIGVIFQHTAPFPAPAYLCEHFWIRFAVATFFLITGYTWFLSYKRANAQSIGDAYKCKILLHRFTRLIIPWIFMFVICSCFWYIVGKNPITAQDFFKHLLLSGFGFGDYFLCITFQLIVIYPILYLIVDRYKLNGFIGIYIFTIFFELFRWATDMNTTAYMCICIRYFAFIGFGGYLAKTKDDKFSFKNWKIDIVLLVSFAVGFIYLFFVFVNPILLKTSFLLPFANGGEWMLHSNFIGALYWLPVMYILMRKVKIKNKWVGYLGRASYSIYLTQMTYFVGLNSMGLMNYALNNFYLQLLANVSISFSIGFICYWLIEKFVYEQTIKLFTFKIH